MKRPHIKSVRVGEGPMSMVLEWSDRKSRPVELGRLIESTPAFAPLADPELFATVRVAYWGHGIAWGEVLNAEDGEGPIDMGADQLWRWAGEQAGEIMPAEAFRDWRQRNRLSLTKAAAALGLGRRTVAYYDSGALPVPKMIKLATIGFDAEREREAA